MPPARGNVDEAIHRLPLSPQVFQVLISLADRPRHGYAIIQEIKERTEGGIRLTASTLYDALTRLVDQGWIEEVQAPANVESHDSRRRYYQLSELGREVARHEALRLEQVLESARNKRLLPKRARK